MDSLTAVVSHALTYDEIDNPLSYYNGTSYTMDWVDGRRLNQLTGNGKTYTYKYDLNGIRTWKKCSDGSSRKYYIVEGKTVGETVYKTNGDFAYNLRYTFDEKGSVCGICYWGPGADSWTKYYFTKNSQGDVTGVYRANTDLTGIPSFTPVAAYTYDSWGNVLTKSGEMADINPFRYRSYYQDDETGFYYLQSRYYDPSIGRFINADTYSSTGQGFLGHNMFAYCANDPVNKLDPTGEAWWHWVAAAAVVAVAAVAVVATAGGAAGAVLAVASVANGVAVGSTATTIAAGAFIGSATALGVSAYSAYLDSNSPEEFAERGAGALTSTLLGGGFGMAAANSLPGHNCFVAGTLVQTENGAVVIEEIQAGDMVWAWDEETGDVALKKVVETYINETDELVHLSIAGEEITCTPTHPFYSPVKGWTDAVHLRAGDILVLVNGEYVVVEKVQHEILEAPIAVYNFQVADYHTYYVSDAGVLVHNKCGSDVPDSPSKVSNGKLKNVDVHAFKEDYVKPPVSHWDVYKDTANHSELWLGNKAQTAWVRTGLYLKDLPIIYPK